jgi:hypothetical protein
MSRDRRFGTRLRGCFGAGTFPISQRAKIRAVEYFSESFASYRFEDSFADKDPEGYHMVEAILRLVGKI